MELGHLLTRSGLTYPEVSSKVFHDSFCQVVNSVSLPWVIYCEAFYLHVVSIFSCIPVVCLKLVFYIHTECPRRNVPDLGRVFLMLKYTDITQNTSIQS